MNIIHIPKAINNKVEMTDTYFLTSRKPVNSEAMTSQVWMPGGVHPNRSLANLQFPLNFL